MDVFDAVRSVRAIRAYRDTPLPEPVVNKIVEAARLTASSINKQPWHFVVVQDRDTLRRLGELASTGPYIAQAPLAVAVAYEQDSPFGLSDASRAIQDMVLVAWAEGVGSNWVGFGNLEEAAKLLGIPGGMTLLAIVPFGYPAQAPRGSKKNRKPLGEVASRDRFGQPFG
jgi:nitroreductase